METVLIAFFAGMAGGAAFNCVIAPLWHFWGIRDAVYTELLVCASIKPQPTRELEDDTQDIAHRLRRLAAELVTFDQSAGRLTRAILARKGYEWITESEALIDLSRGLKANKNVVPYLVQAKKALRLPDDGFPPAIAEA